MKKIYESINSKGFLLKLLLIKYISYVKCKVLKLLMLYISHVSLIAAWPPYTKCPATFCTAFSNKNLGSAFEGTCCFRGNV